MNEESFDIVIIGCGPAGLSGLLWASELGLSAVTLESNTEPGGQLLKTFNKINNHLGTQAANGHELRDVFLGQVSDRADIRTGISVASVQADRQKIHTKDGFSYSYRSLVIATGVRRRKLDVPGEVRFQGQGILQSGKLEGEKAKGKNAVVVGGGDAAFENALILSDYAAHVSLIHRRSDFSAREEFIEAVNAKPNIEIHRNTVVTGIAGNKTVESVAARNIDNGRESKFDTGIVVIRIGVVPNSELVSGICETDERGYISVDANGLTSAENIFAAGDVANPNSPTISTAIGMASTAVKTIRKIL